MYNEYICDLQMRCNVQMITEYFYHNIGIIILNFYIKELLVLSYGREV